VPTFYDIIQGAKLRADLLESDRVRDGEWARLTSGAIESAWNLAMGARPDFQVTSADFTVVSGGSASIATPANFYGLVDVVYAPDTQNEYSLGPFNWLNRRSPGGWLYPVTGQSGAVSARLMGTTIYIEPSLRAAGSYRLWYVPKPKICKFSARLATVVALPAYTAGFAGPGKTLTANANGVLPAVDGTTAAVADRIVVKSEAGALAQHHGIYVVTSLGSGAAPWVLTRASDFCQTAQVALLDQILVEEGTTNGKTILEVSTYTALDTGSNVFITTTSGELDAILAPFTDYLKATAAVPAAARDDDLDIKPIIAEQTARGLELKDYFGKQRISGPARPVDTDALAPIFRGGGW
jgi:hypothetical protein